MKIGMELEYWVVDENGKLTSASEIIEESEYLTNEFVDSLLEIQLPPVESTTELRREMVTILSDVLKIASANGKHLVPLGTPLTEHELPIITDRGRLLKRIYGEEITNAKNCAGMHVHFDKGLDIVRQLNLLTALDPALALVSSSPYYGGERLAMSSRALKYRSHSEEALARYRDLWEYVDSLDEWDERVADQYEALRAVAAERGISEEEFESYIHAENAVLTPVRLRKRSPTVEWRAPDTSLPSHLIQLVEDVQRLIMLTDEKDVVVGVPGLREHEIGIPPYGKLRALSATAISDGLASDDVRKYLTTMGFDLSKYAPIAERIQGPYEISLQTARAIRLEYAAALRADVEVLREGLPPVTDREGPAIAES